MKQRDRFGSDMKEKLTDFRVQLLSLDEIITWLDNYYKAKYFEVTKSFIALQDGGKVKKSESKKGGE